MMASRFAASMLLLAGSLQAAESQKGRESAALPTCDVEFVAALPDGPLLVGMLRLSAVDQQRAPLTIEILQGRARLPLPRGSSWRVQVEAPKVWAPEESVVVSCSPPSQRHELLAWPLGRVAGTARRDGDGAAALTELTLELSSPPFASGKHKLRKATASCRVQAGGSFECGVPATSFDLVARAPAAVPHYRWGQVVGPTVTAQLGTLVFKPGASIAGWVKMGSGSLQGDRCRVSAGPVLAAGGGDRRVEERLRKTGVEIVAASNGFFQFAGLAPGTYAVSVRHPGLAEARVFPIEVWPGSETFLNDAIVLHEPLSLELSISPQVDWLGRPWWAEVHRASDFSALAVGEQIYDGPAGSDGLLRIPGQSPGVFKLAVGTQEDPLYVDFPRFVGSADEAKITIEIPMIWVEGKVTSSGEPFPCKVIFGGRFGAVAIAMDADEEGLYSGVLPRAGDWVIDLLSPTGTPITRLKKILRADGHRKARMNLEVPELSVSGRVVDEAGNGVEDASVFAQNAFSLAQARSEGSGRYEIKSLPAGRVTLRAEKITSGQHFASETLIRDLVDFEAEPPADLVLHASKGIRGQVVGIRGPVAGAQVVIAPAGLGAGAARLRTDEQGRFHYAEGGAADRFFAILSPPGYPLTAVELPYTTEEIQIPVPAEGGLLEILLPENASASAASYSQEVEQNGLPLPVAALFMWASGHGKPLTVGNVMTIPSLAPGHYRVCIASSPLFALRSEEHESALQGARCREGYLSPAATLQLDLRGEQAKRN